MKQNAMPEINLIQLASIPNKLSSMTVRGLF